MWHSAFQLIRGSVWHPTWVPQRDREALCLAAEHPVRWAAKRENTNLALVVSMAGIVVAAIGLLGLVAPGQLTDLLARWRILTALRVTIALRIGFGTLFLVAAPYCRLPDVVRIVGVIEFAGAMVLLGLGSGRLRRFVAWWLERPPSFVRYWCSAAFSFGLLLAYAGA